jgi:hypothetical protein
MFESELPIAFGKARIEDQLQGPDKVTLADLVFADDDNALACLDIDFGEIRKVAYFYPRYAHTPLPLSLFLHAIGARCDFGATLHQRLEAFGNVTG